MQVVEKKLKDIIPYEKNPRKNDSAVDVIIARWEKFTGQKAVLLNGNS